MKSFRLVLNMVFASIIFTACTSNIEFDGEITEPKVVLHSFISPDSIVTARVSLSRFFLSDTLIYKYVTNADVSLFVNGVFTEKLNHTKKGMYIGTYKPAMKDIVKLVVKVPDMNDVSADAGFCHPPVIESVDTTSTIVWTLYYFAGANDTVAVDYTSKVDIKLKFTDNAKEKNFYRLIVMKRYYDYNPRIYWDDLASEKRWVLDETTKDDYSNIEFTDPVNGNTSNLNPVDEVNSITGEPINASETYNVFSDELFNGKTYTLSCSTNNVSFINRYPGYEADSEKGKQQGFQCEKTEIFVSVQGISEEYYYYLKSRSGSIKDDFFSEPVQILSNVKGGIGFMGGYTTSNVFRFMIE